MTHYDQNHLAQLRTDAKISAIDLSRAKIRQSAGGGYSVALPRPLFEVDAVFGDKIPSEVTCTCASEAEGELLTWMLRIERAERKQCRIGRVVGWSPDQINRRPLTAAEVADYKALIKHRADVERLQDQLAEALQSQKQRNATQAGVANLVERYGLEPKAAVATPAVANVEPADVPLYANRQAPSIRKGAKR
jgi:hypothetical protein